MQVFEQIVKWLPILSSKGASRGIELLAHSDQFSNYLRRKEASSLNQTKSMRKVLVISDANIGDTVNIQSCIEVLRYYFPDCEIDYVYSDRAHPLIAENPNISNTFPLLHGRIRPSENDRILLRNLVRERSYDLIINLCPFLSNRDFKCAGCPVIFPMRLVAHIVRAQSTKAEKAGFVYKLIEYINDMVFMLPVRIRPQKPKYTYSGNKIYLPEDVFIRRKEFMKSVGLSSGDKIVFFNPDASNPYTFIPRHLQLELVEKIFFYNNFDFLLLGSAFTFSKIEMVLLDRIPYSLRKKVIIVPKELPIDICASLVDGCEVFISGDTGMMHIAAARKIFANLKCPFKNRTAVVSIFGATEPKIYGYDSFKPEYILASQDAPSKVFEAQPDCKNITCSAQRVIKKCLLHKCFQGIDINGVVKYVVDYLSVQNLAR
ncbi:MAG: glycosyltransferase family 9 protein [bacterium]